ncbi:hypothetical protein ACS0TY_028225 [Phlomoides rotata]
MAIMSVILIMGLLITLSLDFTVGQIGVNYGRMGCRLPTPSKVVALYQQYGIQRMRIYDTDPATLQALCGSKIELTVGVLHSDLESLAASSANAEAWVQDNICKYPTVDFRNIIVGNEVSPIDPKTSAFAPFVLPALQNIYDALTTAGLDEIQVSTSIDTGILEPSDWPEDGRFRSDVAPHIDPIVRFLFDTNAPLFASIYPYFAFVNNPGKIDLRYALLDPSYEGVVTPKGVRYQNLFYAILDTVITAAERSLAATAAAALDATDDGIDVETMQVKGGEGGMPDKGSKHTKPRLAKMFINNLIQVVKKGSPKRPDEPIETYIFAMFDENQKPGNETERHFGLFYPSGRPKYRLDLN